MTITTCPKCGSMNITTAGTCANCGWSQFAQVTVSSGVYETIGELEIKMSGKALLDDYKRLLFENNSLTARIAELEAAQNKAFDLVRKLRMYCFNANWDYSDPEEADEFNEFDAEVCEYLSEYKVCIDQLTAHSDIERQDDKWTPEVTE